MKMGFLLLCWGMNRRGKEKRDDTATLSFVTTERCRSTRCTVYTAQNTRCWGRGLLRNADWTRERHTNLIGEEGSKEKYPFIK